MSEPRTHYQISVTTRQALGLFAGLLLALVLAFFFGLMAGDSGRGRAGGENAPAERSAARVATAAPGADIPPPVETGVPAGSAPGPEPAAAAVATAEPTAPATIHPFEDSAEEEAGAATTPGSRTSIAGGAAGPATKTTPRPAAAEAPAKAPAAPSERIWVQAASLSSREEANALGTRLSKHGFRIVVLTGSGPKGRIYRVRVGPYRSETEATHAVSRLSRQEKIREPWIVPEGK